MFAGRWGSWLPSQPVKCTSALLLATHTHTLPKMLCFQPPAYSSPHHLTSHWHENHHMHWSFFFFCKSFTKKIYFGLCCSIFVPQSYSFVLKTHIHHHLTLKVDNRHSYFSTCSKKRPNVIKLTNCFMKITFHTNVVNVVTLV